MGSASAQGSAQACSGLLRLKLVPKTEMGIAVSDWGRVMLSQGRRLDQGRVAHTSRPPPSPQNWNSVKCANDDSEVVSAASEDHPSSGVGEFKLKMEIVPFLESSSKYIRLVLFHNTASEYTGFFWSFFLLNGCGCPEVCRISSFLLFRSVSA
jgi:hypothetical protein